VEVPIYDFKQSKRVGYRTQESPASNVIIIEGIYALSDKLRPLQDLRVSISGGVHFDLVKRVMRDIDRSGQEPEDIIHQISETVYPMYKAFIEPDLRSAHLRVVNSFNPFAGFQVRNHVQSEDTRTGKYPRRRRSIHSDCRFVFSIFPTRTGAGRIMVGECQFTALSSVPRGDSRTRG
jgi:uridine kinase